jgi:catechol 2,3-dioxygenase-like lactoylglutathione lyase family enzyme
MPSTTSCFALPTSAHLRFLPARAQHEPREERPGKWSLHFGSSKISLQDVRASPGSGNFCLRTDTPIEAVVAHLEREGVAIAAGPGERVGATGQILLVYFRDPDGNLVEVSNRL